MGEGAQHLSQRTRDRGQCNQRRDNSHHDFVNPLPQVCIGSGGGTPPPPPKARGLCRACLPDGKCQAQWHL